jgi:ADP-ribosylglycohydrolase
MLGAIIGDTVGSAYEFHNTKDYNFTLFLGNSAYTDDSVMTMAVAYWLLQDKEHSYQGLEDIMVMFAEKYPCPMGGYGGGFYTWLFEPDGLYNFDDKYGSSPYESKTGRHPYGSWGNGSAMRVSAVGWFFDTLEETERVAAISSAITHNHPEGIKGAQATAATIWMARNGKDKEEIREYIEKTYGYDLHKTYEYWHPIYHWESSCQGTVPQAIIAFLDSVNFEDAIRKAVSLGGDSDTLACITGGIAEAFYKDIPEEMIVRMKKLLPRVFKTILFSIQEHTHYRSLKYNNLVIQPRPDNWEQRITPAHVSKLSEGEVFVFGSNLAGMHGGGAARAAYEKFGAVWGQGTGLQGQSYAIPTMQGDVDTIEPYVDSFIAYAKAHPEKQFLVTRIGCGIAGFLNSDIAPLFEKAVNVDNISLPKEFWEEITQR